LIQEKTIESVYFGGGTPSLLELKHLKTVMSWIRALDGFQGCSEITIEANPEDITLEKMQAYAELGINRVSIGVQTLNDERLIVLGREHSSGRAVRAIDLCLEAGISNISIDLMVDLPNQTLSEWTETLRVVQTLPITHLSLYNLTIEPHTSFYKRRAEIQKQVPNDEESLKMLQMGVKMLAEAGLEQYEISAFARDGKLSKHNTGYWLGRPFLGYGPSAFSYWGGERFRNVSNLSKYCRALEEQGSPVDFREKLDQDAHLREHLVIQLRLVTGVDLEAFQGRFGSIDDTLMGEMRLLGTEGLLEFGGSCVRMTEKGRYLYDSIASALV